MITETEKNQPKQVIFQSYIPRLTLILKQAEINQKGEVTEPLISAGLEDCELVTDDPTLIEMIKNHRAYKNGHIWITKTPGQHLDTEQISSVVGTTRQLDQSLAKKYHSPNPNVSQERPKITMGPLMEGPQSRAGKSIRSEEVPV